MRLKASPSATAGSASRPISPEPVEHAGAEGLGGGAVVVVGIAIVDTHWLRWASSAGDLGLAEAGDVLDVVGLVGLEEQQRRRSVMGHVVVGIEVRIAGGHHAVDGEPAGVAVIGMQPVAPPRVVAEHDVGLQSTDPVGDLVAMGEVGLQLAVDVAQEHDLALGTQRSGGGPLLVLAGRGSSASVSALGSHEPFEPSVSTRWLTTQPAADHLASVAPHWNSMSSGWAPMASARSGTGRFSRGHASRWSARTAGRASRARRGRRASRRPTPGGARARCATAGRAARLRAGGGRTSRDRRRR